METSASLNLNFGIAVRSASGAAVILLPPLVVFLAEFWPTPPLGAASGWGTTGAPTFAAVATCLPVADLLLSTSLLLAGVELLAFWSLELLPLPLPLPDVEARAWSAAATACCNASNVSPGRFPGMVIVAGPCVLFAAAPSAPVDMTELGLNGAGVNCVTVPALAATGAVTVVAAVNTVTITDPAATTSI